MCPSATPMCLSAATMCPSATTMCPLSEHVYFSSTNNVIRVAANGASRVKVF